MTASELRQKIYRILDQVLETGVPVEIERKGRRLRIVPVDPLPKLERLGQMDETKEYLRCDPEDLVHMDWSSEWKP